jgi:hypothetical protein
MNHKVIIIDGHKILITLKFYDRYRVQSTVLCEYTFVVPAEFPWFAVVPHARCSCPIQTGRKWWNRSLYIDLESLGSGRKNHLHSARMFQKSWLISSNHKFYVKIKDLRLWAEIYALNVGDFSNQMWSLKGHQAILSKLQFIIPKKLTSSIFKATLKNDLMSQYLIKW